MSGVYQRNREVSEYKFFTQAIAIRVEVNKLMASSSVVPKAYRLLNAVPTVETARSIVYNVNRADCFYPNTSFNALERKRYLTLAMDALYRSLFGNLAQGGGAQCRPTRGTIQAEARPRNSGEPATQSSGLSEAAAK